MEYLYFKAAGKSLDAAQTIQRQLKEASKARWKLLKTIKVKFVYEQGCRITALEFPDAAKVPAGFKPKRIQGRVMYVPDRRTKEGKEWQRKLCDASMIKPGPAEFTSLLGNRCGWMVGDLNGLTIYYAAFDSINGTIIIKIPAIGEKGEPNKYIPPDSTPMKASEYWAMKESAK